MIHTRSAEVPRGRRFFRHAWFAWWPVQMDHPFRAGIRIWAWLERVERRRIFPNISPSGVGFWFYSPGERRWAKLLIEHAQREAERIAPNKLRH